VSAAVTRPYAVPEGGGNGRAILLAVVMHALLAAFLFFGIRWQSSPPAVIQAELWSATPQVAAPPPRPVPPPQKVEAPVPEKVAPEPPRPKADIVEKAPAKVEPPKKKEPVKVEAPKPQPKPVPQPPAPKAEPKREAVKTPPPKEAPVRAPSDLANLLAAANGPETSTGKDQQTSGPRGRDTYIGRLVTAIRSQMRYPATAPGNPYVVVRIEQLPNGEVVNVTIQKSSGIPAFDDAVERAVRAASPLPRDENGRVERVLEPRYNMYDK
jgi:colicin import membrane protein